MKLSLTEQLSVDACREKMRRRNVILGFSRVFILSNWSLYEIDREIRGLIGYIPTTIDMKEVPGKHSRGAANLIATQREAADKA
jgi:hypothetical protein